MKKKWVGQIAVVAGCLMLAGCAKEEKKPETVNITVWHYYNGQQQEAFNQLVEEFNETTGKENHIVVEAASEGNVDDLEKNVLEALEGKAGAKEAPNIFAAYTDTAYAANEKGMLVDVSKYLSKEEQEEYVEAYIQEGDLDQDGGIKLFPTAKATEVLMLNKTDWDKFAEATGADIGTLSTIEGVTRTAQAYYEWTDSLTETQGDGKAFFGRDAVANYILSGAAQLGQEVISVEDGNAVLNFDQNTVRKLWDNYYIPFVKGYFAADGKFRSDDIKTGNLVAMVGSTAGATFFPQEVILDDDTTYPIETEILVCPQFEGAQPYIVQQGAGMAVIKKSEEEIKASVEFLKWFTEADRNLEFAALSGYLPVKKSVEKLADKNLSDSTDMTKQIIQTGLDEVQSNTLYTMPPFENATDLRSVLEYSMSDQAVADRAAVKASMEAGTGFEEAAAPYLTDEYFQVWYNQTKAKLEEKINEQK